VGGIHTVLRTKSPQALKEFGDGYFVLGPLLPNNPEFRETQEPAFERIRIALEQKGLRFKLGRWKIDGEPRAILVDGRERFDSGKLLYEYWRDFGINSFGGRWDYVEPVLYATAFGEALEAIFNVVMGKDDQMIAHFHEWLTGAALLRLKRHAPRIATVFTTHATVLGRALAENGRDFYRELESINPTEEANAQGVSAKCYMEAAAAREADIFTTVSDVTAEEAAVFLQKTPDRIVPNGVNISHIPDYAAERAVPQRNREFLHDFAQKFLQKELPRETRFWVTAGHFEYHNKGYDVFLEALAELDREIGRSGASMPPVVVLLLVASGHKGIKESAYQRIHAKLGEAVQDQNGIETHRLQDEHNDPIVSASHRLGLRNTPANKVHLIYSPAYLDGHDGIFNHTYEDIMSGCDLGVFPSFYEPWGYTALESTALALPTVTTDLAGFGRWVQQLTDLGQQGVSIIPRKGRTSQEATEDLYKLLARFSTLDPKEQTQLATSARRIALQADWNNFFPLYQDVYNEALRKVAHRVDKGMHEEVFTTFSDMHHCETPRYRPFSVVTKLPDKLKGLHDIAYNLWWSWDQEAKEMFTQLDPELWKAVERNPIQLLNRVSSEVIAQRSRDGDFLKRYRHVLESFNAYMHDTSCGVTLPAAISPERPIVYFSMEYGLHECLPVYSGGLGILSGDHLKSASDLNLPLVGVGLFYQKGYFVQSLDRDGNQHELYPMLDFAVMPVRSLMNADGSEALVSVQLPGRTLFARVWIVQVGRVNLYLMDTNIDENHPQDREISSALYGGDRKMRIEQEILLGIGGVRLVRELLKVEPSVYHLNEGHVAFLTLERIKHFMRQGLNFQEAREAVRASTVFTTHTPVPAGNEEFNHDLMEHYLRGFVEETGITWGQLLELGHETPQSGSFSMTVLALKLSNRSNAVSKLHGRICQSMWQNVWKGLNLEEVPIFPITNGIHLATWVSRSMRNLLDRHLEIQWGKNEDDEQVWEKVDKIPDQELRELIRSQKVKMIERIKEKTAEDYARRGEFPRVILETVQGLRADILTIGFARRLAGYKRSNLFLRDLERLKRLMHDPERPLQIIIAGKSHPADDEGKGILKQIMDMARSKDFIGKILFLENYNMGIGRLLVRGVDVWLNNPLRPLEASGTSGMKVGPNGGLNFSILDGWWDEAYRPEIGWRIKTQSEYSSREHQDEFDNIAMMDMLEREIIPLYYDQNEQGFSPGWVAKVKASMKQVSSYFNTLRMLKEYFALSYCPTAERQAVLCSGSFEDLKSLTLWKQKVAARFGSVQIPKVTIRGIRGDILEAGGCLQIDLSVNPGKMEPGELRAELVLGLRQGNTFIEKPLVVPMQELGQDPQSGELTFHVAHNVEQSGSYLYGIRVVPWHPLLSASHETGLVCWA
ncbi:MAG: alpha-glucan family phosphorylase, partial [Deltaproteobacteria bacterium]|nr:alpha-glucan family phosphorylase [Deltaproteobacteria bacterium]